MDIRYQKLIQYKSVLDNSFRKSCITEIYNNDYSSTLQQAKLDGYRVMRNSSGKSSTIEKFNELF